ncbi:chemotaxis protein CheX [Phosphitispora sp. TUW77]|uniref:chemotaxis protein CheX n=1 Tax=Phosphitispora sp. TUW77 TaxID=3152361 RepID=UPI003AB7D522
MKAEFINPFIIATKKVLSQELGKPITTEIGSLTMQKSSYTALDMTVLIGVTGSIQGIVMFGLSERAVKNFVSGVLGEPVPVIDAMVESAIAEMGNVVTGHASTELEKAGYPCTLAPPTVITGRGVMISTINIQRLQVPLKTDLGDMEISVALKETK